MVGREAAGGRVERHGRHEGRLIEKSEWSERISVLDPKDIMYFESSEAPMGIFFVFERHRGLEYGVLIGREALDAWSEGELVETSPDHGFRRLGERGQYWYWHRP